jgi:hypothetical protein
MTPAAAGKFVVLIEGEHSEASTSRKLVKSLKLLGVDDQALGRVIIVARKAVVLGSPEWADIVRLIAAGLVSDIALDTVARVAPGDANDEREQVAIFDAVSQALERAPGAEKPICWAVAHTRKNGTSGELSDVSGSVQRTGQADSVLLLKAERVDGRVLSTRVTFAKLREDPDDYPEPVEFTISKGPDETPVLKSTAVSKVVDNRPLEERILEALTVKPMTKSALSKLLGRNKPDLEQPISNLFAARAITTASVTIKGRDYAGFAARPGANFTPYSTPYSPHTVPTPYVTPDDPEPC